MKSIFTILVSIFSLSLYSQNYDNVAWCPAGATWIYHINLEYFGGDRFYSMYQYEKDTSVSNLDFKKINKYSFSMYPLGFSSNYGRSEPVFDTTYLFYKSNDSIFYLNSTNNLKFLYTFSDSIGFSWNVSKTTLSFRNISSSYPNGCDSIYFLQDQLSINDTGEYTINQTIFKYTQTVSTNSEWSYGKIYKNIGPSKSFFATPNFTPSDSCMNLPSADIRIDYEVENNLAAYYDDEREYSFDSNKNTAHYLITSIKQKEINDEFLIFPNPSNQFINLKSVEDLKAIIIFDANGRKVKTIRKDFNIISIKDLSKGIYFLDIYKKESRIVKKITRL